MTLFPPNKTCLVDCTLRFVDNIDSKAVACFSIWAKMWATIRSMTDIRLWYIWSTLTTTYLANLPTPCLDCSLFAYRMLRLKGAKEGQVAVSRPFKQSSRHHLVHLGPGARASISALPDPPSDLLVTRPRRISQADIWFLHVTLSCPSLSTYEYLLQVHR